MKKQLLLGLMAITMGLSACKKDIAKAPETTPANVKQKVNVAAPTYVELQPYPNQPGTYFTPYAGITLIVTNLHYDNILYPPATVKEGTPALGLLSIMETNVQSSLTINDDFHAGTAFTVNTVEQNFTNYQALRTNLQQYSTALSNFLMNGVGSYPFPSDFIKTTYSSGTSSIITTPGRLICLTTGSHWAIAPNDYVPPATVPTARNLGAIIDPNDSNITYFVYGLNGNITKIGTNARSATGTYTITSNPMVYTVTVTITRSNGTSFTFTGDTIDLS